MYWLERQTSTREYQWQANFPHVSCLHSFVLLSKGLVKMCHVVNGKISNVGLWKQTDKQHNTFIILCFYFMASNPLFLQNRQEVYLLIVSFNTFFLSCASFYRIFLDYSFANFFYLKSVSFKRQTILQCLQSNYTVSKLCFFRNNCFLRT